MCRHTFFARMAFALVVLPHSSRPQPVSGPSSVPARDHHSKPFPAPHSPSWHVVDDLVPWHANYSAPHQCGGIRVCRRSSLVSFFHGMYLRLNHVMQCLSTRRLSLEHLQLP